MRASNRGIVPALATAMILAAGLGTRLRPLTEELPKALLPLGDRPVLAHVVEALQRAGIEGAVLNAHHLAPHLLEFTERCPFLLEVVVESEIRGTAGGVAGARHLLGAGPVLVVNADHVFEFPASELLQAAAGAGFSMAVRPRPCGEGRVGLGRDGQVVRLRDERFGEEVLGGDYLSVCALGPEALRDLPELGCLVGDFALPRLRRGGRIDSVTVSAEVLSIGDSLGDYLAANERWLAGRPSYVADGVRVPSAVALESTVLGSGAEVSGAGTLSRCVVWPGARVRAPLAGAVVTSRVQVVV